MRKHRGGLFLLVLICGIAVLTAFWYFATPSEQEPDPAFGGDYIEGITGAPSRVNPLFAQENVADQTLVSLVFAGLTRLDDRGAPFPDLASTWSVSQDGLTYTFALRPGLLWQDGQPLTADDVVFTYDLLLQPGLRIPPPLAAYLEGATVAAPDAATIVITLPAPFSPLPAYLTLGILPQHLLQGQDVTRVYDSSFNQQPVGAGPYRLDRLTPGEADLVASPTNNPQQPFLQHLQLRFYHDEGDLFSALDARTVNAALFHNALGDKELLSIERGGDLHLTPVPTGDVTFVYLNLDEPVFADRRVRQALLYAIDRDEIVHRSLNGQATTADSPIAPGSWAYSPSLQRYQTDPLQAGLLLDDAGWKRDADGIRRKDGQPLAFKLTTTPDPVFVSVAQSLAEAWNALGAQVTVDQQGMTTLVRDLIGSRSYQALLLTDQARADPDPYDEWHSAGAETGGANLSGLADARFDALLEQARNASFTQRKDLYESFQELFAQEVPAIPLYASTASYIQTAALQGAVIGLVSRPGDRFWQVQEWYLKTR